MIPHRLRIHVISETEYVMKGQGVHTAYVDCVALLKSGNDVDCIVNQEGWGEVMHSHTYGPYYFWKGRRYPGRRIITAHVIPDSIRGSLPAWRLLLPLVRWYFGLVYSFADVSIAISPVVEETLRAMRVKSRIVRINNPVRAGQFVPSPGRREEGRKLLNLPPDAFVVLGVGQLEGRKGVIDFVDVAESLPRLQFVWVGGRPFGPFTEGVKKLDHRISRAVAENRNIRFSGPLSLAQMPLVYSAADLLLFPSYQENSPLVPVEAAAADLPVIFRDLPEYARLYSGRYLKAGDNEEFTLLTKKIAEDPVFRQEAIMMSRNLLSQFDAGEIRRQLVSLYREIAVGGSH